MDTSKKQTLKAQAHHLKPVVTIGSKGLSDAVIDETSHALKAHELIKVKIQGLEKTERLSIANKLCHAVDAELIQFIGNTAIIYRQNHE